MCGLPEGVVPIKERGPELTSGGDVLAAHIRALQSAARGDPAAWRHPDVVYPPDLDPNAVKAMGFDPDIERAKRDLQASLRGDDRWRHPDLYAENIYPDAAGQPSIQSLVVKDIEEREEHGIRTYGRAIYADTPNDPVEGGPVGQAYREALDLVIYLRWFIERHGIEL